MDNPLLTNHPSVKTAPTNHTRIAEPQFQSSSVKQEEIIDSNEEDGSDDEDGVDVNDDRDRTHSNGQHHPIAEFLYQLTKMLTDENNEIIEWIDGRIKVHYPERLEGDVLHKYFRHSKFASFQRQLNYFGFRKIAGKGKMSPCSYVNEDATSDIRSLLLIKRKTNGSAARKAALQQRMAAMSNPAATSTMTHHPPYGLPSSLTAATGLNFPGMNVNHPNLLFTGGGGGTGTEQQQALANAMALLTQSGITTIPNFANTNLLAHHHQQQNIPLPSQPGHSGVDLEQLNLFALQQQQQFLQKQLLNQHQQAQQNQTALNLLHAQQGTNVNPANHGMASIGEASQNNSYSNNGSAGMVNGASLDQLQAQLKAFSQQQQLTNQQSHLLSPSSGNAFSALLNQVAANQVAAASSNNMTSLNLATAALNALHGNSSASSGAHQQQPATAAMNASMLSNTNANNLFESAINLKSLLDEHKAQTEQQQLQQSAAAQALFNRLPPQSGAYSMNETAGNNNMSTMSLGNLVGSSNRLSSLLSLNSFLGSREPSLADFTGSSLNFRDQFGTNNSALNAQLTAAVAAANAQSQNDAAAAAAANIYRSNNN